ncbi:MAG: hypothetical protein LBR22_10215 [Desulfovibrio sp.]|jgi:carbamoyltransferase|nr:hypothetical protein [Desulfovibrio sp.]
MNTILGISAYYHDSAAALLQDGVIVAAAQEERFSRVKGDARFPHNAVGFCLEEGGLDIADVDHVVFYENPLEKFDRLLQCYLHTSPGSLQSFLAAMPKWLSSNLWMEKEICRELGVSRRIQFCDHHLSHAASAFFPSPFRDAAIVTIDGVGEWATSTIGVGEDNTITLRKEMRFPNSIGLLYSAFTAFTGFKINSGEYKLMGLAPYGRPVYKERILRDVISLDESTGAVTLNQKYFNYTRGLTMTNEAFNDLFGGAPRTPETDITQREMDIAASIQEIVEDAILAIARHALDLTLKDRLVMAGGVALNVVACGRLAREGIFPSIWVQPASGDAGGALGAALWHWHMVQGKPRTPNPDDDMRGSFLGPDIPPASPEDDEMLTRLGAVWETLEDEALQARIAELLADERIVAVARGRMEWGPRALGARSILGDARSPRMQAHMNLKIKFRESFRPFAPMVLAEHQDEWFEPIQQNPYMLLVSPVREERRIPLEKEAEGLWGMDLLKVRRSQIPAVTHVDYSARLQTVDAKRNPFTHGVIVRFMELTGCPVIINTSFNVRGEPIVCTCEDAYRCFMATEIDALVVGNRLMLREEQKSRPMTAEERAQWLKRYDLD